MATTRIKDISKTTTDLASDTYGVFDGATNGTQKMARNDMYADWAAAYVAAPTTYKLAPLNSGTNKIDATYLPTSGDTPKGEWNANTNSPALADGSGTAGDYYDVTTAGTQDLGSGSIAYTVGDVVKYNGSTWYKIDSVANILDGSATAADGRSALSVNSIDEDAEATGTKLVGPALYFDGSNDYLEVSDSSKLSFSSSAEFGTNSSGTWSPDDNTPALTDGTGTTNQHYRVDSGAGTVTQGGSTLSIINGTATTAGQAVYYDGSVWRLKDVDDLPFSVSAWVKVESNATNFTIISKNGSSAATREYAAYVDTGGKLSVVIRDTSLNSTYAVGSTVIPTGQWTHVSICYPGAGPNSDDGFTANQSNTALYVNGKAESVTPTNNASYTGMSDTSQAVHIGRSDTVYARGHIRNVQIYNRSLTATEVAQLARGTDLGFADEWAGSEIYSGDSSTFTSSLGNWTLEGSGITVAQSGGEMVITNTAASTGTRGARNIADALTEGKRYRVTWTSRASSGTGQQLSLSVFNGSPLAAISKLTGSGTAGSVGSAPVYTFTPTGSAEKHSMEFILAGGGTDYLYFKLNNTGAGEVYNFDDITLTEIGTLADFRAENFIADKLIDLSSNNFVGTNNGATLVGGRKALQLDTDGAAAGNKVLSVFDGSTHLGYMTDKGDLNVNSLSSGAATELTIATGAVTATKSHHTIDTESDAATDDLDTISGGRAGQLLVLRAANGARDVVLKDGTGNLKLSGDITLDNTEDTATLISDGTNWYLLATSNNGA